jgi:hypothetical protein
VKFVVGGLHALVNSMHMVTLFNCRECIWLRCLTVVWANSGQYSNISLTLKRLLLGSYKLNDHQIYAKR